MRGALPVQTAGCGPHVPADGTQASALTQAEWVALCGCPLRRACVPAVFTPFQLTRPLPATPYILPDAFSGPPAAASTGTLSSSLLP